MACKWGPYTQTPFAAIRQPFLDPELTANKVYNSFSSYNTECEYHGHDPQWLDTVNDFDVPAPRPSDSVTYDSLVHRI